MVHGKPCYLYEIFAHAVELALHHLELLGNRLALGSSFGNRSIGAVDVEQVASSSSVALSMVSAYSLDIVAYAAIASSLVFLFIVGGGLFGWREDFVGEVVEHFEVSDLQHWVLRVLLDAA